MSRRTSLLVAVLTIAGSRAAFPQDSVQHIRDLYSAAAYEDVLSTVDSSGAPPEMSQYRVFSLVALGRPADAEKAVEDVLAAHPRFHPDSEASPRILDLFGKVRRRMLPDLLKTSYGSAKAALDRKDREAAIKGFEDIVAAADDPDLKDDKLVAELRLLAAGFLELSRAVPVAAPAPAPAPVATVEDPETAPLKASGPIATPPVPIHEVLPAWNPPTGFAQREFRGAIRVAINAEGKVESSSIVTPIYPTYDVLVLRASQSWTYQPGRSKGAAVPSERVVQVVLKPR
jgi:hypothetical protein